MIIKGIITEDFVNYKLPSMVIEFPRCSFKCGEEICHNNPLIYEPDIQIDVQKIVEMYINNPISEAVVCQGLEPFDSWKDLLSLVDEIREHSNDDIVIFTGYNEEEVRDKIAQLEIYNNIIVKFGRFIPNQEPHFDDVLGVNLASHNQYAKRVS